jgi:hypothetical protein
MPNASPIDVQALADQAAGGFRRLKTNATKMRSVWIEIGEHLITLEAALGGSQSRACKALIRTSGLNKVPQQDRNDAKFMAENKEAVEKLVKDKKVRATTSSPSSFRKLLKAEAQPKPDPKPEGKPDDAEGNSETLAEGTVNVSQETREKMLQDAATKTKQALTKVGLSEADIKFVGQLLAA